MSWGYRIAAVLVLGLFAYTWIASTRGYGLNSNAGAWAKRDRSVRAGGIHSRPYMGGGPRFGK